MAPSSVCMHDSTLSTVAEERTCRTFIAIRRKVRTVAGRGGGAHSVPPPPS